MTLIRTSLLLIALMLAAQASPAGPTLANLQEAYNGEVNAEARYLACADRADAEGYSAVAGLFRAAAAAEHIHADNQATVIRALGAEPQARLEGAVVGATRQNLRDALEGERYEQETMYPEFIAVARREGLDQAVRSLTFAAQVEHVHAQLFAEALAGLDEGRFPWTSFMVCPTCGGTRPDSDPLPSCRFCDTPQARFLAVH